MDFSSRAGTKLPKKTLATPLPDPEEEIPLLRIPESRYKPTKLPKKTLATSLSDPEEEKLLLRISESHYKPITANEQQLRKVP